MYVGLKKFVLDAIEENMASNGNLSDDVLGGRMDEFHNSWEISLDIKLSYFNPRVTSVLNIHGLPGINMSDEAKDKYIYTTTRI